MIINTQFPQIVNNITKIMLNEKIFEFLAWAILEIIWKTLNQGYSTKIH